MVLFKRKPVQFLPRPEIDDDNAECWIIPETEEVFLSYESYLQRMDWYKARRFICQISGHSGLSFFDALKSEKAGAREVEGAFPEMLKGPVLRKVQFSTTSRIDNLVDQVYDVFKQDFFPGEHVTILMDGERVNGVIREKATFPEIKHPDTGEITREAFTRYLVRLAETPDQETLVDDSKITRDRKVFTKQMLRSFIKNTVSREAWTGAPWLVHESVAQQFKIDTDVPLHLQHSYKVAEKKERKKTEQQDVKGRKLLLNPPIQKLPMLAQADWEEEQRAYRGSLVDANGLPIYPDAVNYPMPNGHAQYPPNHLQQRHEPPPPAPVPNQIKYPLEDMDCPPRREGDQRPPLSFLTTSQQVDKPAQDTAIPGLKEHTVGLLLEVWNTLNVYCQVLTLDSFTFDDFVEAMQFSSTEVDCELLDEIHCALLKKLVNPENEQNGAVQISLPDLPDPEESEEEEEEEADDSRVTTPTPEPDVPARRTRSSLNKMALAEEQKPESEASEESVSHRAAELFSDDYGWIGRLRKRDFKNGGWQVIVAGLLHQVAGRPRLQAVCERILIHLAPLEADPTIETVRLQYSTMDINLRAEALQTICQLFLETKTVKVFLEEMARTMTEFRKTKIEHQRARKESIAVLKKLHDDRRLLAPLEQSPTPVAELEELEDAEKFAEVETEEVADSDEDQPATRTLRRGQDRAAERKRKREEEELRKEKAREEKATKGSKEYQRVLAKIEKERDKIAEHEEQIEVIDGDLREADAYRTRCLGKDRFCNRYWWFERNAMPYGGLPDSSTADAGYANGRLWVQGPDDMERLGYIDVDDQARNNYFNCFQMTPAERKIHEEGPTNLHRAHQWGYYETAEDVDKLIEWLDQRGFRELKLKKELNLQRDMIAKYMEKRRNYINPPEKNSEGRESADTDDEGPIKPVPTRMSTRTKVYVSDELTQQYRCLRWRNTTAVEELGHRHIDPPPVRDKGRKGLAAKRAVSFEVNQAALPMQTRRKEKEIEQMPTNRQGKPVTRQGSRYNF